MSAPPPTGRAGWRALGAFWVLVLLATAGLVGTLQHLGPLPAPPARVQAAVAPVARPGEISPPLPALLEPAKDFPPASLPRVAADGRAPRLAYARPAPAQTGRPRVAMVVDGLGMSATDTKAAIEALPAAVSLAFSPYGADLAAAARLSREAGHETLISIPLESAGFPLVDAGSHSLLTGAPAAQNALNLEWALSRMDGYAGAIGALEAMRGERFAEQTSSWKLMLDELKRRGLFYVDPRPGKVGDLLPQVPGRSVDAVVDDPPTRAEIEAKLAGLERTAREKGVALGLAGPLRPLTVERVAAWAKSLGDRGVDLVPASALVNTPAPTATADTEAHR